MTTIDFEPAGKLRALEDAMRSRLYEREDVVRGTVVAMISQNHVFLIGPPGGAKTLTADLATAGITGARKFGRLLSRYSQMEDLWGPPKLSALERDSYERNLDGTLADAELAVIDEIWKCNASLLNSMLEALNERRYRDGAGERKLPLVTAITASNELPESEELEALYDRIMLRYNVQRIRDRDHLRAVLTRTDLGVDLMPPCLSMDDLRAAQDEARKVEIPDDMIDLIIAVKDALEVEGIVASDRRWRGAITVLRACAYLEGRDHVTADDLEVLAHVMWRDPAEEDKVRGIVSKVTNPEWSAMLEKLDAAQEILTGLPAPKSADYLRGIVDAQQQITGILEEAAVLKNRNPNSARVTQTFDRILTVARTLEDSARAAATGHSLSRFLGGK